jgi:hypothetical protein
MLHITKNIMKNIMKGLIRVAASVAFYDFVPTIPALRELAECQTRCADMYTQFKGHGRLVNALLGQTSMAEYATEHMELAAPVLHY